MKDIISQTRLDEEKNLLSFTEGRINVALIQKLFLQTHKTSPDELSAEKYSLILGDVSEDLYRLCCAIQSFFPRMPI